MNDKNDVAKTGASRFLLGIAASLRLVQVAKRMDDGWAVRLSPFGQANLFSDFKRSTVEVPGFWDEN